MREAGATRSARAGAGCARAGGEAAAAAAAEHPRSDPRPTAEELGYYTTDDSFTKIIDDATEQIADRVRASDSKRQFTQRLADLFGRAVAVSAAGPDRADRLTGSAEDADGRPAVGPRRARR